MGVDCKELKLLKKKLEKDTAAMELFMRDSARELAARALRKVVERTPVDTGLLQSEWAVGEVYREGDFYKVEIYNPMEYASYAEFGNRTLSGTGWVEGQFFLTISEQELQRQSPAIIEARIAKKLGEYFK